jgi:hypothetical protein
VNLIIVHRYNPPSQAGPKSGLVNPRAVLVSQKLDSLNPKFVLASLK